MVAVAAAVALGGVSGLRGPAVADRTEGRSAAVSLSVSGDGVGMFPAYADDVDRYAITTTTATAGEVTVSATGAEPRINGRPAGGPTTLTGLAAGDEISVLVDGRALSLVYLPAEFPALERVRSGLPDTPTPGHVLLTLGKWVDPGPFFETAVDANGVPVYVRATPSPGAGRTMDLKPTGRGGYTVFRPTAAAGRTGSDLVELDAQFREIQRRRTDDLVDTDPHDAIVLPDGSAYLLAYEPDPATGRTDAVIQHVSGDGSALFEWNSADHVDPAAESVTEADGDYAHINSVQVLADGDLLASFRHFSSVFKIARTAHDGYAEGEVIWRMGGRRSDWSFVDEQGQPDGGPCAQHTAYELANGNVLIFDNGSSFWSTGLCVDQNDPTGPVVERHPTRITEWSMDEQTRTATMVWNYQQPGRFAIFAGSAQRLDAGTTLVGWASSPAAVATEIGVDGNPLWELRYAGDPPAWFTYRAFKSVVPDRIRPDVTVTTPSPGAAYRLGEVVAADAECTDRGGSTLQSCQLPEVDTSRSGSHSYRVRATDGDGNSRVVRVDYTVLPDHQPDAAIKLPGGKLRGVGVIGPAAAQRVGTTVTRGRPKATAVVRVTNTGERSDRVQVTAAGTQRGLRVRYPGLPANGRSPRLAPGESWTFKVTVTRLPSARSGDRLRLRLRPTSLNDAAAWDAVGLDVRVRR